MIRDSTFDDDEPLEQGTARDRFDNPPPGALGALAFAQQHLGAHEIRDKATLHQFFKQHGYSQINPATVAWCAAYTNSVLEATGYQTTTASGIGAAAGAYLKDKNFTPASVADVQTSDGLYLGIIKGKSPRTGMEGVHVGFLTGESRINPQTGEVELQLRGGNQQEPDAKGKYTGEGRVVSDMWIPAARLHLRKVPTNVGGFDADELQRSQQPQAEARPPDQPGAPPPTPLPVEMPEQQVDPVGYKPRGSQSTGDQIRERAREALRELDSPEVREQQEWEERTRRALGQAGVGISEWDPLPLKNEEEADYRALRDEEFEIEKRNLKRGDWYSDPYWREKDKYGDQWERGDRFHPRTGNPYADPASYRAGVDRPLMSKTDDDMIDEDELIDDDLDDDVVDDDMIDDNDIDDDDDDDDDGTWT